MEADWLVRYGPAFFGAVIGWMAHAIYFAAERPDSSWLASMIGVIGGAGVTALFGEPTGFYAYSLGMCAAFFVRVLTYSPVSESVSGRISVWLSRQRRATPRSQDAAR